MIENKTKNKYEDGLIIIHHTAVQLGGNMAEYNRLHKQKYYDKYPSNAQPIGKDDDGNDFEYPFVAYHYIIQRDGTKYQNRNINQIGYHAGNYEVNCGSIAISIDGNFEKEEPTKEQIIELKRLLKYLKKNVIKKPLTIKGHKDVSATACPGRFLYVQLKDIENEVNKEEGYYEKLFYKTYGNSSIYSNIDFAISELVDTGKIDREFFFFNLIGLERAKNK